MDTKRNYGAFYALMREMPHADKGEIIRRFTNGRTDSLREMTADEYHQMLHDLRTEIQHQDKLRKARSEALHQLQRYGINTADWGAVNSFCYNRRIAGKCFIHLSIKELQALTNKMRAINHKKSQKPKRGAWVSVLAKYAVGEA